MSDVTLWQGDCLALLPTLPAGSVDCVITSPPYNLAASPSAQAHRNTYRGSSLDWQGYGDNNPDALPEPEYQAQQIAVLRAIARVLQPTRGVVCYVHCDRLWAGQCRTPDEWLIPLTLASDAPLRLRQRIVWDQGRTHQHNPVYIAPTHEYVYVLTVPGIRGRVGDVRRQGSVWHIPPINTPDHPAPYPPALVARCLAAYASEGATVLDPYMGRGTTGVVSVEQGHSFIGIEQDATYYRVAAERIAAAQAAPQQAALHVA